MATSNTTISNNNTELYSYSWEVVEFDETTKTATVVYTPTDTQLPTITKTMMATTNALFYVTVSENAPKMDWFRVKYMETTPNVMGQTGTGIASVYIGSTVPPKPTV